MKNINNFTQWKNGSVDVTFTRAITHQKHLTQSGRSTRSKVDIFNTPRVFTKEPIREQDIKLECMKTYSCWKWWTKCKIQLSMLIMVTKIRVGIFIYSYSKFVVIYNNADCEYRYFISRRVLKLIKMFTVKCCMFFWFHLFRYQRYKTL